MYMQRFLICSYRREMMKGSLLDKLTCMGANERPLYNNIHLNEWLFKRIAIYIDQKITAALSVHVTR